MPNAEISSLTVPVTSNGTTTNVTYDFKDATARTAIGDINTVLEAVLGEEEEEGE